MSKQVVISIYTQYQRAYNAITDKHMVVCTALLNNVSNVAQSLPFEQSITTFMYFVNNPPSDIICESMAIRHAIELFTNTYKDKEEERVDYSVCLMNPSEVITTFINVIFHKQEKVSIFRGMSRHEILELDCMLLFIDNAIKTINRLFTIACYQDSTSHTEEIMKKVKHHLTLDYFSLLTANTVIEKIDLRLQSLFH
jgi:hypothetical protein